MPHWIWNWDNRVVFLLHAMFGIALCNNQYRYADAASQTLGL
jgi:hypothetical protein